MQSKRTPAAYHILMYLADTVLDEPRGEGLVLIVLVRRNNNKILHVDLN